MFHFFAMIATTYRSGVPVPPRGQAFNDEGMSQYCRLFWTTVSDNHDSEIIRLIYYY